MTSKFITVQEAAALGENEEAKLQREVDDLVSKIDGIIRERILKGVPPAGPFDISLYPYHHHTRLLDAVRARIEEAKWNVEVNTQRMPPYDGQRNWVLTAPAAMENPTKKVHPGIYTPPV